MHEDAGLDNLLKKHEDVSSHNLFDVNKKKIECMVSVSWEHAR